MTIAQCISEWGRSTIIRSDPIVAKYRNTVYVPFNMNKRWGIFDLNGSMVEEAIDYRGPEKFLNLQTKCTFDASQPLDMLDVTSPCLYTGRVDLHYGHFLINTLSRFWYLLQHSSREMKVLVHSPWSAEQIFSLEPMAAILTALRLGPENFIIPCKPVRVSELIVPSTSFGEQNFAHEVFRDLCLFVGRKICGNRGISRSAQPVYLTKEYLKVGVGKIINETILSQILLKNGVEIVAPERLTFEEQISLFNSQAPIIGTATSAMHTSIFANVGSVVICVHPTYNVNSNFVLIDQLVGNRATYLYEPEIEVVPDSKFLTARKLADPEAMAHFILHLLRRIRA